MLLDNPAYRSNVKPLQNEWIAVDTQITWSYLMPIIIPAIWKPKLDLADNIATKNSSIWKGYVMII